MDATQIDYWKEQGPWALLFVAVLFVVGRFVAKMLAANQKREDEHRAESKAREDQHRIDSKEREERLMAHNEKMSEAVNDLTAVVTTLTNNVEKMGTDLVQVKDEIAELKQRA